MKNPWEDGKKEVESLFKERMAKITKSGEGNRYLDPQTEKKRKKKDGLQMIDTKSNVKQR